MIVAWCFLLCGLIGFTVCLAAEISACGKDTYGVYIMRQCHGALVYNLQTCCKSNLAWLQSDRNCHWEYFPQNDICLSPTHPPAQPPCPSMFCSLLSRVNRAEIAQLPTLFAPQCLDVTPCRGGGQNCSSAFFGLFTLEWTAGRVWDWPQRLYKSTETDWTKQYWSRASVMGQSSADTHQNHSLLVHKQVKRFNKCTRFISVYLYWSTHLMFHILQQD